MFVIKIIFLKGEKSVMNVSLTPELEAFVHRKVESGMYNSASEVIRESLRLLEEKEWSREWRENELRTEIMSGIDDSRAGRVRVIRNEEDKAKIIKEIKERGRRLTAERRRPKA